jgi:hypothetical protein
MAVPVLCREEFRAEPFDLLISFGKAPFESEDGAGFFAKVVKLTSPAAEESMGEEVPVAAVGMGSVEVVGQVALAKKGMEGDKRRILIDTKAGLGAVIHELDPTQAMVITPGFGLQGGRTAGKAPGELRTPK